MAGLEADANRYQPLFKPGSFHDWVSAAETAGWLGHPAESLVCAATAALAMGQHADERAAKVVALLFGDAALGGRGWRGDLAALRDALLPA